MADQPVYAPDQLKPSNRGWARVLGITSIIALLVMTRPFNNHDGWVEDVFLVLIAGLIAVFLVGDAVLHRNGLRR